MYFVKTPTWLKSLFNSYTWHVPTAEKKLYLSFDDGPHPVATPFVLKELAAAGAKATFFCLGKNVQAYPGIYKDILSAGHTMGNHTQNHLNGWKTGTNSYIENVEEASSHIHSLLFRPPYGRITRRQGRLLLSKKFEIIMWDVLSGDFDTNLSSQKCLYNVVNKSIKGSIIVFHDSEKAYKNLSYALPRVLEHFSSLGFCFEGLKPTVT